MFPHSDETPWYVPWRLFALGLSYIDNPGYNRARGRVWVPSVRFPC
jgi:hypothetical protein